MTDTTCKVDTALLGYAPAEAASDDAPSQDDASSGSFSSSAPFSPAPVSPTAAAKSSLRKLMVSCIDSALEELGPLTETADDFKLKPVLATSTTTLPPTNTSNSVPSAEDLYGYGSSCSPSSSSMKVCPELALRGRIRRPRYQRRGSVTKFSLSNALKQVQKDESEGKLKDCTSPSRQLWQHLYAKMDDRRAPLKRSSLDFSSSTTATTVAGVGLQALTSAQQGPSAKRRRGACA